MAVQSPPRPDAGDVPATGVYCYGITAARDARPQQAGGLGGRPVRPIVHRELAALVSEVPPGTVRARRRDLLAHFDVLGTAFEHGTVLPLRFGIVFDDDEAAVRELLEPRHHELVAQLRELADTVELRVTAHYREDALLAEIVRENPRVAGLRQATQGGGNRAALLELGELVSAEVQARTARDSRALIEGLRALAKAYELDEEPLEYQLLRGSFLVERKRLAKFERALDEFAGANADRVDVKLVGPLPPHSFVALAPKGRG